MNLSAEKIRGWTGAMLALITIALCIWKGFSAGLIAVAIIFAFEVIPVTEKILHPSGKGRIQSYLFDFHYTWYSFWLCIVFGAWSLVDYSSLLHSAMGWTQAKGWLRFIIWLILAWPVLTFQAILSYWLPLISVRFVHIESDFGPSFCFLCLGTWWGNGMKFLWLPDGKLLFASQNEFGWSRHVFDSALPASRNSIWFVDAILIGVHPPVVEEPFEMQYFSEKGAGLDDEEAAVQISRHYDQRKADIFKEVREFLYQAAPRRIGQALNNREVRSL